MGGGGLNLFYRYMYLNSPASTVVNNRQVKVKVVLNYWILLDINTHVFLILTNTTRSWRHEKSMAKKYKRESIQNTNNTSVK